jgi:hypothetical protein
MLGNGPLAWEEQRRRSSGVVAMDRPAEARGPTKLQAEDRHFWPGANNSQASSSSNPFVSLRSAVSKPSVNQP